MKPMRAHHISSKYNEMNVVITKAPPYAFKRYFAIQNSRDYYIGACQTANYSFDYTLI